MLKNISLAVIATLALTVSATASSKTIDFTSDVVSNVNPIPYSFLGKWATTQKTGKRLTPAVHSDICLNGGDKKSAVTVDFDGEAQSIIYTTDWDNVRQIYPMSYTSETEQLLAGSAMVLTFNESEQPTLKSKHNQDFSALRKGTQLYFTIGEVTHVMKRCSPQAPKP